MSSGSWHVDEEQIKAARKREAEKKEAVSAKDRARAIGIAEASKFISLVERSQRVRVQKLLWEVTDENRKLGGKKWKKVLRHFGLKESDVYLEKKLAKNQERE